MEANKALAKIYAAYRPIAALQSVLEVLHWDQEVVMPQGAAAQRAEQLAALQVTIQEKIMAPALEEALLSAEKETSSFSLIEQADLRELRRAIHRAKKLPPTLVCELARQDVLSVQAWSEARQKKDFSLFASSLRRMVELKQQYADALRVGSSCTRYDALLQEFEPNETEDSLHLLFEPLQASLVHLIEQIQASSQRSAPNVLQGVFPIPQQEALIRYILNAFGFSFHEGRLDTSTHPFCSGVGTDIRITTRYDEHDLCEALFGAFHEVGHALYEQGIARERIGTPSGVAASLGLHESQSRLWENMIARSLSFWKYFFPILQSHFSSLQEISLETFWRTINRVEASWIRTQADEVTYNLHILLRFDLERALIAGDLSVSDLPLAWNSRFERDFGACPPDDALGVLQDIHWASGLFGYFPTYTLGNLYAAQWLQKAEQDLPALYHAVERGELTVLREWLRDKIHRHGRTFLARSLCEKVTGETLSPLPFVRYLSKKYSEIYAISWNEQT